MLLALPAVNAQKSAINGIVKTFLMGASFFAFESFLTMDVAVQRIRWQTGAPDARRMNTGGVECVQDDAMSECTFPIEFIGGSRDGEMIEATAAPDYYEIPAGGAFKEIYERQNSAPPFVYVQIGYARNETWK